MKTGIILEIKDGKAYIMKAGGEFLTVKTRKQWKKGDVVSLSSPMICYRSLCTAAACFLILCSLSSWGYRSYFHEATVVSLDVNPSIEIKANRFDRVIAAASFNEEGDQILDQTAIQYKRLEDVIETLLDGALKEYIKKDSYLTLTVQSDNKEIERTLLKQLQHMTEQAIQADSRPVKIEIYAVDKNIVANAHSHHVTAGKYTAMLQLQVLFPQMDMEEYTHCSIGEIKQQIGECSAEHQNSSENFHSQQHGHDSCSHNHDRHLHH